MKKVAPVVQGAVNFFTPVGLVNDVVTLSEGEDMYGNEAEFSDKIVSSVDLATLGYAKGILKVGGKTLDYVKKINFLTTDYSAFSIMVDGF